MFVTVVLNRDSEIEGICLERVLGEVLSKIVTFEQMPKGDAYLGEKYLRQR